MRPEYYGGEDNTYEVIKVIRAWGLGFELGNCAKYIKRAGKKDKSKAIEDLQKAKTYIGMEIQRLQDDVISFSDLGGSEPKSYPNLVEKQTSNKADLFSYIEFVKDKKENETFLDFIERKVIKGLEQDVEKILFGKDKAEDEVLSEQASVFYELSEKIKEANEGWTPNWDDNNEEKWYPWFDLRSGKVALVNVNCCYDYSGVPPSLMFKSEEICRKFVEENMELYEKLYKP